MTIPFITKYIARRRAARYCEIKDAVMIAEQAVAEALGRVGEKTETLIAQLPHIRNLHDWLVRIEGKLDRVLREKP